ADELLAQLPGAAPTIIPFDLETPFRNRFTRLPLVGKKIAAFNADRLLNRQVVLSRFLRGVAHQFDCIHVADHTYANVVHALTPRRAGVYCHALDAFQCLLSPEKDPRPWWFRRVARRIPTGLQAAAVVFYNSRAVGRQLVDAGLAPAERLVHAPLGVA